MGAPPSRRQEFAGGPLAAALVATALVLSCSSPAHAVDAPHAGDKVLPCRPTIACTADIVSPGTLEVEAGALFRRLRGTTRQWSFPFLFKLTAAEWVQWQLGSNGYSTSRGDARTQYLDDVVLGPKLHLHDQTAFTPSFAVSAELSIPTFGGQPGYLRAVDALFTLYVTKDLGPVHIDFNVGGNAYRLDGRPLGQEFVTVAASATIADPVGAMVETYVFSDAAPLAPRDGGLLFALSLAPASFVMFDAGGDVGFYPASRAYSLFVGATFIPAVLWRAPALP